MDGMLHKTIRAGILRHLTFSPDGNLIAGADHKNIIRVYNLDGKLLLKYTSHKDDIEGIVFSPDGQKLASSSEDDIVRIWTVAGKTLATMNIRYARMAMAFSPTSDSLITGGERINLPGDMNANVTNKHQDKLQHWQLDGTLNQEWDGNTVAVKFLSRSQIVAINDRTPGYSGVGQTPTVRIINIKTGKIEQAIVLKKIREITKHEHIISKDRILGCFKKSGGGGCKLFNAYGEVLQVFNQYELSESMSINAVSPDGMMLATNHKQLLTIWQVHDPEQKRVIPEVK